MRVNTFFFLVAFQRQAESNKSGNGCDIHQAKLYACERRAHI